ncbi:MAG: hypothetical protein HY719_12695 [Planctomycetes bacterium]|nr:hypothetical protein [Planctomycetota bacterium]
MVPDHTFKDALASESRRSRARVLVLSALLLAITVILVSLLGFFYPRGNAHDTESGARLRTDGVVRSDEDRMARGSATGTRAGDQSSERGSAAAEAPKVDITAKDRPVGRSSVNVTTDPAKSVDSWLRESLQDSDFLRWDNTRVSYQDRGLAYQTDVLPFAGNREIAFQVTRDVGFRVAMNLADSDTEYSKYHYDSLLQSLIAASAYVTDKELLDTLLGKLAYRDEVGHPYNRSYVIDVVLALGASPGLLAKYVRDDHECGDFPPPTYSIEYGLEKATEAAWNRGENLIPAFEAHTLRCRFCREHPDSHMVKLLAQMREWQATEDRALEKASGVLAQEPKFWVVDGLTAAGDVDVRDVLDAVRRARAVRLASEVRSALQRLRADFAVPEEPGEFDEGPFQFGYFLREQVRAGKWSAPASLGTAYEIPPDESAAEHRYGRGGKAFEETEELAFATECLIEKFIWTLFKIDAPMTDWERKLLYHHRLIGDPKEHLRAAGFPPPGDPPPAPPEGGTTSGS